MKRGKFFSRVTGIVMAAALAVVSVPVTFWITDAKAAQPEKTYKGMRYTADSFSATITGFVGSPTSIDIPEELDGVPVTEIKDRAFYNCGSLKKITFPHNIEVIGNQAFEGTSITSLYVPFKFARIGTENVPVCNSAFCNIDTLKSITFEEGTIYTPDIINDKSLEKVTIPDSVYAIGCFRGCSKLKDIKLHEGVTRIGPSAFYGCKSITNMQLPESLEEIEDDAFTGTGIKSITIPKNVKSMYGAFNGANALKSVTFEDGITEVPERALYGASKLESATIPGSVLNINTEAFKGCKSLKNLSLSEGLVRVKDYAFNNCYSLKKLNLPESIQELGNRSFSNTGITSVKIPSHISSMYGAFAGTKGKLKKAEFESGMKIIPPGSLCENHKLKTVIIPDTVTKISHGCFKYSDRNLTLRGKSGSCVQTYAKQNKLKFKAI